MNDAPANPDAHPAQAITFDYHITPDDLVEYRLWCEFHRAGARRTRRHVRRNAAWTALAAVVLVIVAVWYWTDGPRSIASFVYRHGLPYRLIPLARLVGLVLSLIGPLLSAWWLFNALAVFTAPGELVYARRLREHAESELTARPRAGRLTVTGDGVRHESGETMVFTPWEHYEAIHETPSLIVSCGRSGGEGFVPKRCLGSGEEAKARAEQIKAWARARGGTQEATLFALLADRDARCADCGYNLRGVRSTVCPECGVPIEVHFLPTDR